MARTRTTTSSKRIVPVAPPAPRTYYSAAAPPPAGYAVPQPSFFSSIIQGVGWGAGSSVGHKVVDSLVGGGGGVSHKPDVPKDTTKQAQSDMVVPIVGLDAAGGDPCKPFYDAYQECVYSGQSCDAVYERYVKCVTESQHIK